MRDDTAQPLASKAWCAGRPEIVSPAPRRDRGFRRFDNFDESSRPLFTCNYCTPHLSTRIRHTLPPGFRERCKPGKSQAHGANDAPATKKYHCFPHCTHGYALFLVSMGFPITVSDSGGFPKSLEGGADHTLSDWVSCIASAGQKRWYLSLRGWCGPFLFFFIPFDDDDGHAGTMGRSSQGLMLSRPLLCSFMSL